jgi:uncharacterized RDD family membrane protein YckC
VVESERRSERPVERQSERQSEGQSERQNERQSERPAEIIPERAVVVPPSPLEISADELIKKPGEEKGESAFSALDALRALSPQAQTQPPPPPGTPSQVMPPAPVPMVPEGPPPPPPPPPVRPGPVRSAAVDHTLSQVPISLGRGGGQAAERPAPRPRRPVERIERIEPDSASTGDIPRNVAGFFPRLGALLVDDVILLAVNLLLLSPVFLILFFRGELQPHEADWAFLVVAGLCGVLIVAADLWYVVGGWARTGRTPGKSLLGLAVVGLESSGGGGIGVRRALLRAVCVGFLGFGAILVLFRKDRRALHDLLAGTWVVKTR